MNAQCIPSLSGREMDVGARISVSFWDIRIVPCTTQLDNPEYIPEETRKRTGHGKSTRAEVSKKEKKCLKQR